MRALLFITLSFLLSITNALSDVSERTETSSIHVSKLPPVARMGDIMPMHIDIKLAEQQSIDPESLPLTGRVTPWLDLRSIDYQQRGQYAHIALQWQIFATVEKPQVLKTPAITLKLLSMPNAELHIASQPFYYAAGLPFPLPDIKRLTHLPPFKFDEGSHFTRFVSSLLLASSLLFAWAWVKDLLPFLPFNQGPITRLARTFRQQNIHTLSTQQLQAIHHALNAAAGISLYPCKLGILFEKAPFLKPLEDEIAVFFNTSWAQQYNVQSFISAPNIKPIDTPATLAWIQQAAVAERLHLKLLKP